MKLNEENLEKLYLYFKNGGSFEYADVGKFLNVPPKNTKAIDEAIEQLKEAYPKLKEELGIVDEDEEVPAPVVEKTPLPIEKPQKVVLISETGIGEELEITGTKNGNIYVKRPVPDEVTVKIGGKDVVVDITQLRKKDSTEQLHGVSVATLLVMAQIAKG